MSDLGPHHSPRSQAALIVPQPELERPPACHRPDEVLREHGTDAALLASDVTDEPKWWWQTHAPRASNRRSFRQGRVSS